jgi:NTP pyrophosphatase (non-canonical NTP hydrolase)
MHDLEKLQQIIRKFCDDRDWGQFHNLKDLLISLSLESAEALEQVQWKNDAELQEIASENKALSEELADVLYWTLLIANKLNIDLSNAFTEKMKQNEVKYPVSQARGSHKKYTEFT